MIEFSDDYIEGQRLWLLARRESKKNILEQGGERALLHSPSDIKQIDFALKRIADGQYGICLLCGHIIERERLDFKPEILLCIECQNDSELRQKAYTN